MQRALLLALLFACATATEAATVYGNIWKASGQTRDAEINFRNLSTPFWIGTNYVTGGDVNTRSTNGIFEVSLVAGFYNMLIAGRAADVQVLNVPNDTNRYDFVSLQTTANAFQTASLAGYSKVSATDTTLALLSSKLTNGPGIVIIKLDAGGNERLQIASSDLEAISPDRLPPNSAASAGIAPATGGRPWEFYMTDDAGAPGWLSLSNATLLVKVLNVTSNAQLSRVVLTGTTNQVVFGGTNSAPASPASPARWISVQVQGEASAYRIPLFE